MDAKLERKDFPALGLENFGIGGKDQVILEVAADFAVASGGGDFEIRGGTGVDFYEEVEREGGGVEGRAEVGGGGGEGEVERRMRFEFRSHVLKTQP